MIDFSCENFHFSLPLNFSGTVFGSKSSFKNVRFVCGVDFESAKFDDIIFFTSIIGYEMHAKGQLYKTTLSHQIIISLYEPVG